VNEESAITSKNNNSADKNTTDEDIGADNIIEAGNEEEDNKLSK
jgi:hypothetical protein